MACECSETTSDSALRAQALEAYEAIGSLEDHGDLVRLILSEVTLLSEKYRNVRRHDVPHVSELAGLLDVLWQEVEMVQSRPRGLLDQVEVGPRTISTLSPAARLQLSPSG